MRRTDELVEALHRVLAQFSDIPEREMYEELMAMAEGWKMRLEELEDEEQTSFGE